MAVSVNCCFFGVCVCVCVCVCLCVCVRPYNKSPMIFGRDYLAPDFWKLASGPIG